MRLIAPIWLSLFVAEISLAQDQVLPSALASLVAAERAFARTSVEKGFREAFLTFFADDGIFFQPHPVKARETLRGRPARPETFTLNWEPIFGDVSDAGDLGFTTGPYTLSDSSPQSSPPQHGCFFSVWKVQSDGSWKVVIDAGITTRPHFISKWEPIASDIAKSGDLGYTYGRYEATASVNASATEPERGYYVRVWRRDAARRWKLLLDTVSPVPPEQK